MGADFEKGAVGIENDADDQHQQQGQKCAARRAGQTLISARLSVRGLGIFGHQF